MKINLTEFRPEELRARVDQTSLVILPVGTIEWHANHLPLGVDGLLATWICQELAQRTGCVVAPTLWYGVCCDLCPEEGYYGTLATITQETLQRLVTEVLNGLAGLGFKAALVLSGHFEAEHLEAIERGVARASGIQARWLTEAHLTEDRVEPGDDCDATWPYAGDHAAEYETSLMQHYLPNLVEMAHAPETIELPMEGLPAYIRQRYPRRSSPAYGAQLSEAILEAGEQLIREMLAQLPG